MTFLPRNLKYSNGPFTSRTTPPHYILEHLRGCVVIGQSLISFVTAHTAKGWWPALFNGGISLLIWLQVQHYQTSKKPIGHILMGVTLGQIPSLSTGPNPNGKYPKYQEAQTGERGQGRGTRDLIWWRWQGQSVVTFRPSSGLTSTWTWTQILWPWRVTLTFQRKELNMAGHFSCGILRKGRRWSYNLRTSWYTVGSGLQSMSAWGFH